MGEIETKSYSQVDLFSWSEFVHIKTLLHLFYALMAANSCGMWPGLKPQNLWLLDTYDP